MYFFAGWFSDDGQTVPYCMLLRPEAPCRLGQLDLAIKTASKLKARLDWFIRTFGDTAEFCQEPLI